MRSRALAIVAFIVAMPLVARAQPTAQEKESARELFRSGQELRDRGDLEGALRALTQAHALVHTPITAVELARTQSQMGHLVDARETALSVARMPIAASESEATRTARAEAADLAEQLHRRIGTVRVSFSGAVPGQTPSLRVDGVAVPADALGAPVRVDPGKHELVASVQGGPPSRIEVDVAEGGHVDATIPLTSPPAPPPIAEPPVTPPPPPPSSQASATSPLVWIGFGAAVAGVAVGGVTGGLAIAKANTSECRDTRCTAQGISDIHAGRSFALVSTISFAVAATGALVGLYGLTWGAPEAPRAAVVVLPGALVAQGTF